MKSKSRRADWVRGCSAGGLFCLVLALVLSAWAGRVPPQEPDDAKLRERMVQEQIAARGVRDNRVLRVMREIPRHRFVPPEAQREAYADKPLSIGLGQTISQPYIVALMTELVRPGPGDVVLGALGRTPSSGTGL